MSDNYMHLETRLILSLMWESSNEVGLAGGGFTWTGTREALAREFRLLQQETQE